MVVSNPDRVLRDMFRLLDKERDAILTGRIERLEALSTDKARLVAKIGECEGLGSTELEALKEKFDRNRVLLGHAMKGVRVVLDRLRDVQSANSMLRSYDGSGRPRTFGAVSAPTVTRRA